MATIGDKDLELLVWCALSYDHRLPHGLVPPNVWEALPLESRGRINKWKDSSRDQFGAEVRKPAILETSNETVDREAVAGSAPTGWRVDDPRGVQSSYSSGLAAYKAVEDITRDGSCATVYVWSKDRGDWALHERIKPALTKREASQ